MSPCGVKALYVNRYGKHDKCTGINVTRNPAKGVTVSNACGRKSVPVNISSTGPCDASPSHDSIVGSTVVRIDYKLSPITG